MNRSTWLVLAGAALLAAAGCGGRGAKSVANEEATAMPVARASATLELPPDLPATASRDVLKSYFDTEAARLLSAPFLQQVLQALPAGVRARNPMRLGSVDALAAALRTERVGEAFLLRVSFFCEDPPEALRVLDTIAGMFVDEARKRRGKDGGVRILEPAALGR